jgi:glycosyltransferase involved in cell wall biosynthesis
MLAPDVSTVQRRLVIGIDARAATESQAGRGRVVRELLRALATRPGPHRYVCFARARWNEPLDPRFQWKLSRARDPLWHLETARAASEHCDVFLSTNSYLTVMLTRAPSVAIIHDLLVFEAGMSPNRRSAAIEHLTLGGAVRRSSGLVCVSQATADALLTRFPRVRPKVSVAPLAVAPVLSTPPPEQLASLPAPGFVLAVGTLEPRKNLPRLVSAYQALPATLQSAHPLVVVGPRGWRTGATMAALQSLGERCVLLGHVSDEVLAELYRRCAVFCYPSLGEGFGLPVLEAMGSGAAVVTSALSSLPEVGGDAVAYVDPSDVDDIARGLGLLLSDESLRARLGRAAVERSREFSWDRFASQVQVALEKAAGDGDQPSSVS